MSDCYYNYNSNECVEMLNKIGHEGTKYKFEAISNYASSWVAKIIGYYKKMNLPLDELIYVDPMASSGEYSSENDKIIEGTAIKIIRLFESCSKKLEYKGIKFTIYLNDKEFSYLECIRCSMKRNDIFENENFVVHINHDMNLSDKDAYLRDLQKKESFTKKNCHRLVIYDPYDVDFNWSVLGPLVAINDLDLILTHFYPNDFKRNINRIVDDEVKLKYSRSYQIDFEILETEYNKKTTPAERNLYMRQQLNNILGKYTRKYIHLSPIFNSHRLHVYDIVCISRSSYATSLLKDIMFDLYSGSKILEQSSMTLFNNETYTDHRKNGISEFESFYSITHIVEVFWRKYQGKTYTEKELKKLFREDPTCPTKGMLSAIKGQYAYQLDYKGTEKTYTFKEKMREQNKD